MPRTNYRFDMVHGVELLLVETSPLYVANGLELPVNQCLVELKGLQLLILVLCTTSHLVGTLPEAW